MVGDNITFSRNMVISVEDNDVHLTTSHSLEIESNWSCNYQARRACALRALGLLLADGTPTVGGGKTF